MTATVHAPERPVGLKRAVVEELRVIAVAGIPVGVLVAGVGSRLAMLLLRVTSSSSVRGVESDDGFEIGRFTLSGTYNLLMLGAVVGLIGAAAYQWVRPWLLGPVALRYATVGLASGAVVGSMLVHADGIDFTTLTPTWLAIAVFLVLPAIFAVAVGVAVERVEDPMSWTRRGKARWLLPLLAIGLFPFSLFVMVFAAALTTAWVAVRDLPTVRALAVNRLWGVCMRTAWFAVAALGLLSLIGDIEDVYALV